MKNLFAAVLAVAALASPALAADPVEGVWKTAPDDNGKFGHVRVSPCGDRICGVLERSFDATGTEIASPNIGRQIVWDMEPQGGGRYARGKVWSPDRDKVYKSKMVLSGDALDVSGCVLIICRDSHWTRVK